MQVWLLLFLTLALDEDGRELSLDTRMGTAGLDAVAKKNYLACAGNRTPSSACNPGTILTKLVNLYAPTHKVFAYLHLLTFVFFILCRTSPLFRFVYALCDAVRGRR